MKFIFRSPLNLHAWSCLSHSYFDRDYLLSGIAFGVPLGYSGSRVSDFSQANHSLPLDQFRALKQKIHSERRMVGGLRKDQIPFNFFRLSRKYVIPKKTGGFRDIHNLSGGSPSINEGIPDCEASVVFESFDRIVDSIILAGRGCWIWKRDLKDAYRHIMIRPQDWPLLGFKFAGMFF